jgi:hypothetical protein
MALLTLDQCTTLQNLRSIKPVDSQNLELGDLIDRYESPRLARYRARKHAERANKTASKLTGRANASRSYEFQGGQSSRAISARVALATARETVRG